MTSILQGGGANGDDASVGTLAWTLLGPAPSGVVNDPVTSQVDQASEWHTRLVLAGSLAGEDRSQGREAGLAVGQWTYGTSLWGLSLTPADINDVGFGIAVACSINTASYYTHYFRNTAYGFAIPADAEVWGVSASLQVQRINYVGLRQLFVNNCYITVYYYPKGFKVAGLQSVTGLASLKAER